MSTFHLLTADKVMLEHMGCDLDMNSLFALTSFSSLSLHSAE